VSTWVKSRARATASISHFDASGYQMRYHQLPINKPTPNQQNRQCGLLSSSNVQGVISACIPLHILGLVPPPTRHLAIRLKLWPECTETCLNKPLFFRPTYNGQECFLKEMPPPNYQTTTQHHLHLHSWPKSTKSSLPHLGLFPPGLNQSPSRSKPSHCL
jgi:hypothetical protein